MNRRSFIAATATVSAVSSEISWAEEQVQKTVTYRIVMVDPRIISKTKDTYSIGHEKQRSDVMGSVYLSRAESVKLTEILGTALTTSNNVPFCGHFPPYVIVQMDGETAVSYVSVCGLCKTWCGARGELRVLDDSKLMPFLTSVLPLPAAFSKVQKVPDLFALDPQLSFLELSSQP